MNIKHKYALTLSVGASIGLVAGTAINAQQGKSAPGYFVPELDVTDPARFQSFVLGRGQSERNDSLVGRGIVPRLCA
jgi:hypothetical protein